MHKNSINNVKGNPKLVKFIPYYMDFNLSFSECCEVDSES